MFRVIKWIFDDGFHPQNWVSAQNPHQKAHHESRQATVGVAGLDPQGANKLGELRDGHEVSTQH